MYIARPPMMLCRQGPQNLAFEFQKLLRKPRISAWPSGGGFLFARQQPRRGTQWALRVGARFRTSIFAHLRKGTWCSYCPSKQFYNAQIDGCDETRFRLNVTNWSRLVWLISLIRSCFISFNLCFRVGGMHWFNLFGSGGDRSALT